MASRLPQLADLAFVLVIGYLAALPLLPAARQARASALLPRAGQGDFPRDALEMAGPARPGPGISLRIEPSADGVTYLVGEGGQRCPDIASLRERLEVLARNVPRPAIIVITPPNMLYGEVLEICDLCRSLGFALVSPVSSGVGP